MKRLIRLCGEAGAWGFVRLVLWTSENRSDGGLQGITDEDIELAIDWRGAPGTLVQALEHVGFLDGAENARALHDWKDHQPWVSGSQSRSEAAKWSALCRHEGFEGAKRKMPEYYAAHKERCDSYANRNSQHAKRITTQENATKKPAPSPSPSPSPIPTCDSLSAVADESGASDVAENSTPFEASTPAQPPPKKKKGVRARNECLDTLAIVGGGALESVTAPLWGEAAKALKVIREVCPEVTPAQITAAAAAHRAEWPRASCSPSSLAKHWAKFGPQKKEQGRSAGIAEEPVWDWRAFAAAQCALDVGFMAWRDVLERLRGQIMEAWRQAAAEVRGLYAEEVPL